MSPSSMCHLSRVTCHMSYVLCHLSCATCYISVVSCIFFTFKIPSLPNHMSKTWHPERLSPPSMCHMSRFTCHVSYVTFNMSCITCYISNVTCNFFGGEGLLSTGPTLFIFHTFHHPLLSMSYPPEISHIFSCYLPICGKNKNQARPGIRPSP